MSPADVFTIWWTSSTSRWDLLASLGHPANFNGFRVLAALLQRRHSPEANQTLHDVWPLPGLVDCIHIFGGCCPGTEFCHVQNSLCVLQVMRSPIGSVTARHSSGGHKPIKTLRRWAQGATLYSAGRPSRWTLAHIVVEYKFMIVPLDMAVNQLSTSVCERHLRFSVSDLPFPATMRHLLLLSTH